MRLVDVDLGFVAGFKTLEDGRVRSFGVILLVVVSIAETRLPGIHLAAAVAPSAGNALEIKDLAGGIETALVTTVGGLFVGIIAYFAYNILVSKVNNLVNDLESKTTEFMDVLNEPV